MAQLKLKWTDQKFVLSGKAGIVLLAVFLLGCTTSSSEPLWAEGKPKHHTTEGFRNYPVIPEPSSVTFGFYLRRFWGSYFFPEVPADHVLPEAKAIQQYQELMGENTVTWLGHATFLVRLNGMTILTDPFLTENASPFKYFGPKRFAPPGISLKNLPPVDIIVVSHNHLDHLDAETVETLQGKESIQVFVPLGLSSFFTDRGYQSVTELDWYQSIEYNNIWFKALPAVHYSQRGTSDKNKTLWCSWSISALTGNYYFSGDTQYSPTVFKEIGKKEGPYDLAMVSIGAYQTRPQGPASHLTPEEAIAVALETKSKTVLGMHWGTIELSDEPQFEPPIRFKQAARDKAIPGDRVWIMKIGETRVLPNVTN